MKSTESWTPGNADPGGTRRRGMHPQHSDRFDELQSAYLARLHSDLCRLMALRLQLHRPTAGESTVEDLRRVAHSMAGAAAMFEATLVAGAAAKIEETAVASRIAQTHAKDAALRAALDALIGMLEGMRI